VLKTKRRKGCNEPTVKQLQVSKGRRREELIINMRKCERQRLARKHVW